MWTLTPWLGECGWPMTHDPIIRNSVTVADLKPLTPLLDGVAVSVSWGDTAST